MNNLKRSNIKNSRYFYFDDIIKVENFYFDNILLDEKSCENILVHYIWYKTLIGAKPLRIRFHKVEFMMELDIYLALNGGEKYDFISSRIRYLTEMYIFFS